MQDGFYWARAASEPQAELEVVSVEDDVVSTMYGWHTEDLQFFNFVARIERPQ